MKLLTVSKINTVSHSNPVNNHKKTVVGKYDFSSGMIFVLLLTLVGLACSDSGQSSNLPANTEKENDKDVDWGSKDADGGDKDDWTVSRPSGIPCSVNPPDPVDPDKGVSFDPSHMLCVQVEIDSDDYAQMVEETPFGDEAFTEFDCDVPWPKAYNWYEADIAVDGVVLTQVGIRKKGFLGSLNAPVPALKIKTDKFRDDQFLGNTERITLNNNSGDPTHMATCLSYEVFTAAGYPAPLCNLANVVVNGPALGPYTHVEAVKKRFLTRVFGDSSGSLYEGTHTDFVREWLPRWEIKTDNTDPSHAPLLAVAEALQSPDDQLINALEPVLNVDKYITFWALEVLVNHSDGYAADHNNFYVYFDPADNGRAVFIPWGIDKSFNFDSELSNFLTADLPRRLSRIPEIRGQFEAELGRLLEEVWNEEVLLSSVDRYEAQIETAQESDESYTEALIELRAWIENRPAKINEMLEEGLPAGPEESLSCMNQGTDGENDKECVDGEVIDYYGTTYNCVDGNWEEE